MASLEKTDICIVGAGPAGVTASLFLSKWEIPHQLVDQATFPRDKVCGESFDGKAFHTLRKLNPFWLSELQLRRVIQPSWCYSLTNSAQKKMVIQFPERNTPRIQSKRLDFDHFLFQKAAESPFVEVLEGTRIENLSRENGTPILRAPKQNLQFSPKLTLIATGSNTNLISREKLNPPTIFARGYYTGVQKTSNHHEIEIFFIRTPLKGCLILCPMPGDIYNVELGLEQKIYQEQGKSLPVLLKEMIEQHPTLSNRFKNAKLMDKIKGASMEIGARQKNLVDDGLILAGSIALSVNPVTGLGVGNAMLMGRLAAEQIRRSVEVADFSVACLKEYEKEVNKKLRNERWFSYLITRLQHRIDFWEPLIGFAHRTQFVQQVLQRSDLIRQMSNIQFYGTALRSLLKFRK